MHGKTVVYLVLITLIFGLCYPTAFLIWDEVNYFEQAFAYSSFSTSVAPLTPIIHCTYPPGTSLLAGIFIFLFGNKACFLSTFFCVIVSFLMIRKLLANLSLPLEFSWLIFLFPPLGILSRTLMSDLPALMVSTLFFYVVFKKEATTKHAFILGFLGTVGLLIREPIILVVLPFLIAYGLKSSNRITSLLLGAGIGLGLRLLFAKLIFGSFFFYKSPGIEFGFNSFLPNVTLYAFALMVFIPGGLWVVWFYHGPLAKALKVSVFGTLLFFCLYQFNGLNSGLFEGLILGPRFFIPSLPLFCIAWAHYYKDKEFDLSLRFIPIVAILLFALYQLSGKVINHKQLLIKEAILQSSPKTIYAIHGVQACKIVNNLDSRFKDCRLNHWESKGELPVGAKVVEYTQDSIFVKTTGDPDIIILALANSYVDLNLQAFRRAFNWKE